MSDWNLEARTLHDTKRGVIPQKECTRGRSKRHPRPFLVMYSPKNPELFYKPWREPRERYRCISMEHARQMLAKCIRVGLDKNYNLWIEERKE